MAFEELIDQLAFGAQKRKTGPCLGLYLSPDVVYLAETHLERSGKLAVDHLVRIPVPAADAAKAAAGGASGTGTLNTDFLNDNAKLTALIRQSMAQIRWGTKDVFVTLSHHLGLMRYFSMPGIDKRFWRSAVPLEAKKYIPIPFDVLDHDFQVLPMPPDAANKPRQGALVAVIQKKTLGSVRALLQALGLNLVGMELAPCSVLRLWETLEKPVAGRTHCQVHFDGGNIRILIADKGLPVFFREVFLAQQPSLGDIRKIDLGGCLAFGQKQLALGPLAQLRVSGMVAGLPQWGEALSQESGVRAALQDTPALLGIKGGDWGGYAAIGGSLRYLTSSPITLDLAAVGRITDDERRTARDLLALSCAVTALFVGLGLAQQVAAGMKMGELRRYRRDPDVEAVFKEKSPDDVQSMLAAMQKQLRTAPNLAARPKEIAVLKDIVDALPDKVWLERFAISTPLGDNPDTGRSLAQMNLVGHASGPTVADEQALAFKYKEALEKSPVLTKLFSDIQMSLQVQPSDDSQGALDPASLENKLSNRTTFTITGTSRR